MTTLMIWIIVWFVSGFIADVFNLRWAIKSDVVTMGDILFTLVFQLLGLISLLIIIHSVLEDCQHVIVWSRKDKTTKQE